ncbi:MAG: ATP-binding protein [Patescibacteria group bacterium]
MIKDIVKIKGCLFHKTRKRQLSGDQLANEVLVSVCIVSIFILYLLISAGFFNVNVAFAAAKTWTGGGLTNNWSDADNWSPAGAPATGDTVTINTGSKDVYIDSSAAASVSGLVIDTGYSGTVYLQRNFAINGAFTVNAGTFDGGTSSVDVNGAFTNGASGIVQTAGDWFQASTFTDSGSFTQTGGTFTFDAAFGGSGTVNITTNASGSTTFYNFTYSLQALNYAAYVNLVNSFTVSNNLVFNRGTTIGNANKIICAANNCVITVHKDVSMLNGGTTSSDYIDIGDQAGTQNFVIKMDGGTSGSPTNFNLTQSGSNRVNEYANLEFAGYTNLSISTAIAGNIRFGYTYSTMVVDNGGTLNFSTSVTSGHSSFTNNGIFNPGSGTFDDNGSFTNSVTGSVQPSGGTWYQAGTFTTNGDFSASGGTFVYDGSVGGNGVLTFTTEADSSTTFYDFTYLFQAGNYAGYVNLTSGFTVTHNLAFSQTTTIGNTSWLKCPTNDCVITAHNNVSVNASGTVNGYYTTIGDSGNTQNFTVKMDGGTSGSPTTFTQTQEGSNRVQFYAKLEIAGYTNISQTYANASYIALGANAAGLGLIIDDGATAVLATALTSSYNSFTNDGTFITAGYNTTINNTFANNGIMRVQGGETLTMTKDTDSGTVEYTGTGTGNFTSLNYGTAFYDLKINGSSGDTFAINATTTVNNSFTLTQGTFSLGGNFNVKKDWNREGGVFTPNTYTVLLNGTDNSTGQLINGSNSFYNLTISNSSAAAAKYIFTSGTTTTVTNIFSVIGAPTKLITLDSNDSSTWTITATSANALIDYADVSYSVATNLLCADHSQSTRGNNTNWSIGVACSSTYSGSIYSDEGVTKYTTAVTVGIKVNGGGSYTCTNNSGDFSCASVRPNVGDTITIYLDSATVSGAVVTRVGASIETINDMNIYINRLILRHEDSGPITNADIDKYDSNNNANLKYTVSSNNLTFTAATQELHIWTGKTYAPGGNITTSGAVSPAGDIHNYGTLNMGSYSLTISHYLLNYGTVSAGSGTWSSAGVTNATSSSIAGTSNTWTNSGAFDNSGTFDPGSGIFDNNSTFTNNATGIVQPTGGTWNQLTSFTDSGTFSASGGTFAFDSNATATLTARASGGTTTFYDLNFNMNMGLNTYMYLVNSFTVANDLNFLSSSTSGSSRGPIVCAGNNCVITANHNVVLSNSGSSSNYHTTVGDATSNFTVKMTGGTQISPTSLTLTESGTNSPAVRLYARLQIDGYTNISESYTSQLPTFGLNDADSIFVISNGGTAVLATSLTSSYYSITNSGTFNPGSGTFDCNSPFTNNATGIVQPSAGTWYQSANFTDSGTFTASGGTFYIDAGAPIITAKADGTTTFYDFTVNGSFTGNISLANSFNVGNNLLVSSTSTGGGNRYVLCPANNCTATISGNLTVTNSGSSSNNQSYFGYTAQNITTKMIGGSQSSPKSVTVSEAGTNGPRVYMYAKLQIDGYINISYTSNSLLPAFGLNDASSTFVISNGGTAVLATSLTSSYYSITNSGTFNPGSGTFDCNSPFTNNATGIVQPSAGTWYQSANFTDSGTFTASGGTFYIDAGAPIITAKADGTTTFYDFTVNGSFTGNISLANSFNVGNNLQALSTNVSGASPYVLCPLNNCVVSVGGNLTVTNTGSSTNYRTFFGYSGQNFTVKMIGGSQSSPKSVTVSEAGTNGPYVYMYASIEFAGYTTISHTASSRLPSFGLNNASSTFVIDNGATAVQNTAFTSSYYSNTINGILYTNGFNPTISYIFANNGTLKLQGGETLAITNKDIDSGTVEYVGDGGSTSYATLIYGNAYYSLKINSTSGNNAFTNTANLAIANDFTVSNGTFNANALTINIMNLVTTGGALNAGSSNIVVSGNWDSSNTSWTAGTSSVVFTAPSGTPSLKTGGQSFYNMSTQSPTGDLAAYWSMNEATGTATVADSSVNNNTATSARTTNVAAGKYGNARTFDGTNDIVTVPSQNYYNPGSNNFTLDLWANFSTNSVGYQFIYDRRSTSDQTGYILYLETNNTLNFLASSASSWNILVQSSYVPPINQWLHITVVRNGSAWSLLVDGVSKSNATNSNSIGSVSTNPTIGGGHVSGLTNKVRGAIDEVRYYNRALTTDQIESLRNGIDPFGGSTATYTLQDDLSVTNSLNVNAGTLDTSSSNHSVTVGGNATIAGGTLEARGAAINVAGNWDSSTGTFHSGISTVTFNGTSGTKTILCKDDPFYNVIINDNGGTATYRVNSGNFVVNKDFSLLDGILDLSTSANIKIGLDSSPTDTSAVTIGSGASIIPGTNTTILNGRTTTYTDNTPAHNANLGNVVIGQSPATIKLNSDQTVTSLTINEGDVYETQGWNVTVTGSAGITVSGTLDATNTTGVSPSSDHGTTIYNAGNLLINPTGVYTKGTGSRQSLLVMNGGGGSNLSSNDQSLGNLQVSTAGTSVTLQDNLNVDNITIDNSAALNANGKNIIVSGNWSNQGNFVAGASLVSFITSSDANISGSTTFYDLTSTVAGKKLIFEKNKTQTITNDLTLTGASGNRLQLLSSETGTQFSIDPQGTRSVSEVSVKDSNNIAALAINPTSSFDGGDNTNWWESSYTITVTSGAHGSISPDGYVSVLAGNEQSFIITPDAGYQIEDVLVDDIHWGPVSTHTFTDIQTDHTISASFSINTYSLTYTAGANGSITGTNPQTVEYGSDGSAVTATPDSGYHFESWSDGILTATRTDTNIQDNLSVTASFALSTFTLTPSAGVNGSISPQVAQTVDYGSAKTFTFTPNTGYHIDDVLIDGVSQGNLTSYTFSDIQANHIISVSFAINTYSLSANAGSGGTINPSGTKVVNYNASQTYAISANPGYKINKVEVDGISVGTISSHTFTNINADHTISATFVADAPVNTNHTIFVSSVTQKPEDDTGNDGYVTPNGNVTVEDGKNQTFQIVAGENTRIVDVLVDGTSLGSIDTYTFANVQANHTIKAVFIRQFTVTIKVIGDNHGSIAPIEPQTLDYNDNYTFSIIPDSNYRISEILVNQEPFLNNNCVFDGEKAKCTIKKIATEYKIKVKYEKIKSETKKEKNETFIETIVTNITKPFSAIFLGTSAGLSGVGKVYSVVSDKVVEVVKQTPPPVAYSFPYLLFILLGLMILVFLYQTKKEVSQTRKIIKLTELDKNISDQKENFLMLSAHYIRTPLTIISSGTELFLSLEKLPKTIIDTIKDALTNLKTKVDVIFNDINNNSYLKEIKDTDIKEKRIRTYLSPYLWLPIILIAGIAVFSNYLFATVAKININIINYICEALVFAIAAQVLFIYFRKRQIEKANRLKFEAILAKQQVIDSARNTFMKDTAKNLKTELATLVATTETIKNKKYLKDAEKGMDDLKALIEKFEFLSKLEAGKLSLSASTTNLSNLTKDLMKSNQEKLTAKNLTVNLPKDDLSINTDKDKLAFILGNVLDNAIKFNKDQGSINLTWTKENDLTKIEVEDTGVGISKEGQELLFKPFSRGTSTLQFDYEGMGTNLYIAKLVANYLDGDISVESKLGKGTKTTVMIGNNQPINETNQKPDDTKGVITNSKYRNKKAPAMMKRLEKQK